MGGGGQGSSWGSCGRSWEHFVFIRNTRGTPAVYHAGGRPAGQLTRLPDIQPQPQRVLPQYLTREVPSPSPRASRIYLLNIATLNVDILHVHRLIVSGLKVDGLKVVGLNIKNQTSKRLNDENFLNYRI